MKSGLTCIAVLICLFGYGQSNALVAKQHIKNIKQNGLVVILESSEKQLNKLHELDLLDKAKKIKKRNRRDHEKLQAAFRKHFDFCDFSFVNRRDLSTSDHTRFVRSDKTYYVSLRFPIVDSNYNSMRDRRLVIQDYQFHQLNNPFPAYVEHVPKVWWDYFYYKPMEISRQVEKLNIALHKYYRQVSK